MDKRPVPYEKTVFVCTNARPDGERVACGNPGRGGLEVCEALKNEVKKLGLKGKVRVARSGCLDLCERGPNLFVYPDGEWLSSVTVKDTETIVNSLK
jgi:(2Fe-2S) ferredoxin